MRQVWRRKEIRTGLWGGKVKEQYHLEYLSLNRKIKGCSERNTMGELGLDYSGSRQKKIGGLL
jgi:hypothetical protein